MGHTEPNLQAIAAAILATALTASAEALPLANGSHFVGIHADKGAIETPTFGGADFSNPEARVSEYGFAGDASGADDTSSNGSTPIVSAHQEREFIARESPLCGNMLITHAYSMEEYLDILEITTDLADTKVNTFGILTSNFVNQDHKIDLGLEFENKNESFYLTHIPTTQKEAETENNQAVVFTQRDNRIDFPEPLGFCPFFHPLSGSSDGDGAFEDIYIDIGVSLASNPEESFQFNVDQADGATLEAAQTMLAQTTAIPEPGILSIIGIGLLGITWIVRRRQPSRRNT